MDDWEQLRGPSFILLIWPCSSERLKRIGATGDSAKDLRHISINCGLVSLVLHMKVVAGKGLLATPS